MSTPKHTPTERVSTWNLNDYNRTLVSQSRFQTNIIIHIRIEMSQVQIIRQTKSYIGILKQSNVTYHYNFAHDCVHVR